MSILGLLGALIHVVFILELRLIKFFLVDILQISVAVGQGEWGQMMAHCSYSCRLEVTYVLLLTLLWSEQSRGHL